MDSCVLVLIIILIAFNIVVLQDVSCISFLEVEGEENILPFMEEQFQNTIYRRLILRLVKTIFSFDF